MSERKQKSLRDELRDVWDDWISHNDYGLWHDTSSTRSVLNSVVGETPAEEAPDFGGDAFDVAEHHEAPPAPKAPPVKKAPQAVPATPKHSPKSVSRAPEKSAIKSPLAKQLSAGVGPRKHTFSKPHGLNLAATAAPAQPAATAAAAPDLKAIYMAEHPKDVHLKGFSGWKNAREKRQASGGGGST